MNSGWFIRNISICNSYLQEDLWTSMRTKDCSEHMVTLSKHHMKMMNLLYSSNWSTYTAVMNLGLNSNVICITFISVFLQTNIELRQKAAVCANLFGSTYICEQDFWLMELNKSTQRNRLTNQDFTSVLLLTTILIISNLERLTSAVQEQWSH